MMKSFFSRLEGVLIRLGLHDPFILIGRYFPLIILLIIANHFLVGRHEVLDILIYGVSAIYVACLAFSYVMMCWFYARGPESKAPYKQMAYFVVFLCGSLTLVVAGLFIFR